jgi:curved DNA-binding protein CbpA
MSNEDGRGSGETPRTGSFYERLGVNSDASQEEIATRFRELAKQYHPDGGGGDEEKFKALSEAYATLKNATKRARYDRTFPNPNLASRPRSYSQASRAREGGRQTAPPEKGDSNTEAEAVRRREERASRARQRAEEQRQRARGERS